MHFNLQLCLTLFFSLFCLSNISTATNKQAFASPVAQRITKQGKNRQPLFISNTSFVYVSKGRKFHKDPQLYFRDLKKGKEKRITHQRGHLANGVFFDKKGQLFFTSTTDEDKETPFVLRKHLDRFPSSVKNDGFFHVNFSPQEVYSSRVDGSNVRRLTNFSGYDGFPTYLAKKDRLYFSRWEKGKLSLFAKSLTKDLAAWKVANTAGHDLGLQLSPKEDRFIWFRFSPDFKSSQLLLSGLNFKEPQYLTLNSGISWSPTWHPNGQSVIYSARADNMRDFDLFEVSVNGECQRQITSYGGDEFFPTISPDGKTILFTSTQSGHEQIYKVSYPGPLSCK